MHRNHSQHQQFWGKQVRQSQVRDKSPVTPRYASGELRRSVYERDAGQCQYCGAELTYETCQLDHVVPWPKGKTIAANLAVICPPCNEMKSTQLIPYQLRPNYSYPPGIYSQKGWPRIR